MVLPRRSHPPPDQFAIAINDSVGQDIPGVGAGNIETPGAKDIYTFHVLKRRTGCISTFIHVDEGLTYVNSDRAGA